MDYTQNGLVDIEWIAFAYSAWERGVPPLPGAAIHQPAWLMDAIRIFGAVVQSALEKIARPRGG